MKHFLMLLSLCCLWSCSSQKKLESLSDVPFKIEQCTVQEWVGGRAESGSGVDLKINLSEDLAGLDFEKIYFRARALDCKLMTENNASVLVASYSTDEIANGTVEKQGEKMKKMFEIDTNEAVLAYKNGENKLKYVKITNIKEVAPKIYQGRPQN